MAVGKTSLSAGEIIRAMLAADEEVASRATKIYPVVVDTATLPYIVYRRMAMEQIAVKNALGADTVAMEIMCYTADYTESVELAEAVRAALDGKQYSGDGITMRSCLLVDSEEAWQDDAYIQQLTFNVKIH